MWWNMVVLPSTMACQPCEDPETERGSYNNIHIYMYKHSKSTQHNQSLRQLSAHLNKHTASFTCGGNVVQYLPPSKITFT